MPWVERCASLILALVMLPALDTKAAVGYSNGEAVMPAPSSSMRLEDGVAPELGVISVVDLDVNGLLGGKNISPKAVNPTKPVCLVAPCVAGGPSSGGGRGCNPHYHCAVH
ncbi:hypothetical protein CFC21_044402 [Triticum aestivum]|uniref:Uncharacterized protein n=2 Tax=Triticum aestivum TaxID=4565 RepID=A0A9R1FQS0_WHEAT|nr:hypothetical protein CFC21_044402 [Triticum aestivum]CDM86525.1 unnamed protein product [Triticum aestivum]